MLKPQKRFTRVEKKQMKEDKLVTFWFKAIEWIDQYQQYVLGGLAAIIILIAGVFFYKNYKSGQEQHAAVQFANAKQLYDSQNYNAAVDTLVRLTNDYSG
ncbi:MAG: tetratricopeptide repeat protein, partial [candidate division KSB1 bacterium]